MDTVDALGEVAASLLRYLTLKKSDLQKKAAENIDLGWK
jgi:hypothetical protein